MSGKTLQQMAAQEAKRKRIATAVNETVTRLSAMQRTAVIEYLAGASKTEALTVAGYANPDSQCARFFKNPKVQAVIDEFFHAQEMTAGEWVARMSEQAQGVYTHYFYWDEEKQELAIDVKGLLEDGYGYLIKDISYRGKDADKQVIEFQPTFDAQMAIARYLGLFTDKQEISGPGGEPVRFIEVVAPSNGVLMGEGGE